MPELIDQPLSPPPTEMKRTSHPRKPKRSFKVKCFSPLPTSTSLSNLNSQSMSMTPSTVFPMGPVTPPRPFTAMSSSYTCPKKTLIDLRRRAERERTLSDITLLKAVKANYRFIYRINDGARTTNTILQKVCEERGWKEFRESTLYGGTPYERAMRGATGWNLWWSYSIYQFSPYKYLRHWQFTNHNPKGFQFCNKLYLTMYLRKMKAIHGAVYEFYPTSYVVPEDFLRLSLDHSRRASESFTIFNFCNLLGHSPLVDGRPPPPPTAPATAVAGYNPVPKRPRTPSLKPELQMSLTAAAAGDFRFHPVWISKPVAQSQGKGIFMSTDLNMIQTGRKSVVQEYICRPLLIAGYKWDVRIYVCVSAIDPLVIYVYHEGLCRFCTEKYCTTDLSQTYSHLTNASLNKLSPTYDKDKELIGLGCKWSLQRLRQYFKERNINDWLMWQKVMALVVLTVIGDSLRLGYSASNRNCFDLFGFDVLVDEDLKPWLLECNYSPGLGGDCDTDEVVKKPMLHELFNLLGFPDKADFEAEERKVKLAGRGGGGDSEDSETTGSLPQVDKDDVTRQYFDMVMHRLHSNSNSGEERHNDVSNRWRPEQIYSSEFRLHDAKNIYSQNLVVQYLKNQSGGKLSKQVRDQLIAVASKKLRSKMAQIGGAMNPGDVPPPRDRDKQKPLTAAPGDADCNNNNSNNINDSTHNENVLVWKPSEKKEVDEESNASTKKKKKADRTITIHVPPTQDQEPKPSKRKKDEMAPKLNDAEAFQKLKYYFDAGVDYPLDLKTGKFKEFPSLLSVKKDWFNPVKQEGGWIRVYPFDARTTKSPYKSSLTDVRQAVRSMENYLKTAEHVFNVNPKESDEYYKRRMKTVCRRDTEIWVPPLGRPTSAVSADDDASIASQDVPNCRTASRDGAEMWEDDKNCPEANNNNFTENE